jgi:hypothetical protein
MSSNEYESVSEQVRFIVWLSLVVLMSVGGMLAIAL